MGESVKIHHHLPALFEDHHNYIYAIPFICGARTFDRQLALTFANSSYDSSLNVLELEINISYDQYPLEGLYISYLIFNLDSDLSIHSIYPDDPPVGEHIFVGMSELKPVGPALVPA